MALPVFPLPYTFSAKKKTKYSNTSVTFQSQLKQIQRTAVGALRTWTITCRGNDEQRLILENFYDTVYGMYGQFTFYDENNAPITARFASDEPEYDLIREFSATAETHGVVVGFTASITVEALVTV
jgi:hypothetical protein